MTQNAFGDRTQQQPVEAVAAVRPHDDEIGLPAARLVDDAVAWLCVGRRDAHAEPHRLKLRRNFLDQRSCVLEAAVAALDDVVPGRRALAVLQA